MKQLVIIFLSLVTSAFAIPLNLQSEDETNTTVSLAWTPTNTGIVSQSVKVQEGIIFKTIATLAPDTSKYNVTNLSPYTTYTFKVCDTDQYGGSHCSQSINVTTTHTWSGALLSCLSNVDPVPHRTQLLQQTQFNCIDNNLTDIEPIRDLKNIATLNISGNTLSQPFPHWITELDQLKYIYMIDNNLSGTLPNNIGELHALTTLKVANNHITGAIPYSIGELTNLQKLDLSENDINGSIPASIGNLTNLKELSLYINEIEGTLPDSIGSLSSLESLFIYRNHFKGQLPSTIGNLSNLSFLYAYYNNFSGTLPESFGNLTELKVLHLAHNHLSGPIPASFGNMTSLVRLTLVDNDLSGKIPDSLNETNLPNLEDGFGLGLMDNCALYADSEAIPFIDQKASGLGGYSTIINSNKHHCLLPSIIGYLLQ